MSNDVIQVLTEKRFPLILTERREHLELLHDMLKKVTSNLIVLHGGKSAKEREAIMQQLKEISETEGRVILATGAYIGEGFDDRRLDTLFLAMPISFKGKMEQYAGRILRPHPRKEEVRIYNYVDGQVPMLARMFKKRLKAYRAMKYEGEEMTKLQKRPLAKVDLSQLHVVRKVDGVLRPTLAGLLMFGKYPQEFEIQMVITFLQYFGTTETEATPRGERFLDNRKFEGTIPEIVDSAVNQVLANIRKSSLIEGIYRQDVPEYPERAVREAIVNAIAHRDYSHFVRGSYIQIRLFADRLEIQSPGGLYGNVTEDTIEHEQSTRNRLLMRMMEDLHLVENRGSGIRTMLEVMRQANLEPPRFQDRRSSFWVTFRNHTLMSPPAIAWLNQFAGQPLNDHQRLALVYLRHNEQMTNNRSECQQLLRISKDKAHHLLVKMHKKGLLSKKGERKDTRYSMR